MNQTIDVVEWLQERAFRMYGPTMEAAHTKTKEWLWADEITRLRAENERLREALKPFAAEFSLYKTDFPDHFYISDLGFTFGQLRAAAAALEGVTEKSGAGNE